MLNDGGSDSRSECSFLLLKSFHSISLYSCCGSVECDRSDEYNLNWEKFSLHKKKILKKWGIIFQFKSAGLSSWIRDILSKFKILKFSTVPMSLLLDPTKRDLHQESYLVQKLFFLKGFHEVF